MIESRISTFWFYTLWYLIKSSGRYWHCVMVLDGSTWIPLSSVASHTQKRTHTNKEMVTKGLIYVCIHRCMLAYIHVYNIYSIFYNYCMNIYFCIHVCGCTIYVYIYLCIYIYLYIYINVYIHIDINIYTEYACIHRWELMLNLHLSCLAWTTPKTELLWKSTKTKSSETLDPLVSLQNQQTEDEILL